MTAELMDWTNEQHHASTAVGSTMLKEFIDSPKLYYGRYIAETIPKRPTSEALEFGTAFHEFLLEHDTFDSRYSVRPAEFDEQNRRLKAVREEHAAFDNAAALGGKRVISAADMERLKAMRESVMENTVARELVEADKFPEQSIVWTHGSGVLCKARFDGIEFSGRVMDLKTSREPGPREWIRSARNYGYDVQLGLYLPGREAFMPGIRQPFLHIVVGSDPPHETFVYEFDGMYVEFAEEKVDRALERMAECLRTGIWQSQYANQIIQVQP